MGKDLHYSIMKFLEKRLDGHSAVKSWERHDREDWITYTIQRFRFDDQITICLSDAYRFTDFDYHNRENFLSSGDYILVAKPEGGVAVSGPLVDASEIGVGKLGEMMGALNSRQMWKYSPPSDEEIRRRRERSRK
jgi:hypothetical protein